MPVCRCLAPRRTVTSWRLHCDPEFGHLSPFGHLTLREQLLKENSWGKECCLNNRQEKCVAVAEQRVVSRNLMELEESDTLIDLLNKALLHYVGGSTC